MDKEEGCETPTLCGTDMCPKCHSKTLRPSSAWHVFVYFVASVVATGLVVTAVIITLYSVIDAK